MNILFENKKEPVVGKVAVQDEHHLILEGIEVNTSGFCLLTNGGCAYGKYQDYTTLYKKTETGYILSNDGSVYAEPEPIPEPEPIEPTLEEVKESKVSEMNETQQKVIAAGVDVTLADGTTRHFSLSDNDQLSLVGLQTQVVAGLDEIPWHTSDAENGCEYFSNSDMALITEKAMEFITWHTTYFINLRLYINSLLDKESVKAVYYGMYIPKEYQDDVMKDLYNKAGK